MMVTPCQNVPLKSYYALHTKPVKSWSSLLSGTEQINNKASSFFTTVTHNHDKLSGIKPMNHGSSRSENQMH